MCTDHREEGLEEENTSNVYLVKDGTLFLLYGRKDFEKMTNRRYEYIKGLNGHFKWRCMWIHSKKWILFSGFPSYDCLIL